MQDPKSERSLVFAADHRTLIDLIDSADEIRIVAPGLDEPRAHALAEAAHRGADVRVVLDPSEETERFGMGSLRTVDLLRGAGAEVRQLLGNAIGLVVADGEGYLHFARSRMFVADGEGLDAVRLDPLSTARLVRAFFPPRSEAEEQEAEARLDTALSNPQALRNAAEVDAPVSGVAPVDEQRLVDAKEALERNPPRDPDLTRRLNVYTNRLQFVEITLKGGAFGERTVSLPTDIPLGVSEQLGDLLRTRMRVFDSDVLESFRAFKREVDALREKWTTYLASRKKRVFATKDKQAILDEVERLRKQIPSLVSEMASDVMHSIDEAERVLVKEATRLLQDNPPADFGLFRDRPDDLAKMAERRARHIVSKISFPDPAEVLERIELAVHFYDMTWEDFDDEEFIRELYEAEIIDRTSADELRHLRSAFEAKPS
ncbi:MAG: hypothetical protein ABJF88_11240 [Rhodothermales bacterium]